MIIDAPRENDILTLRALWKQAFGDTDDFLDLFFSTAFSSDRALCLRVDGVPIAVLYWFDCTCRQEKIAYLYAVATAREHRGKGLCSVLMDNTHKHLERLGYAGAMLVPSSESLFEFYRKRGYETSGYVSEFCVNSSDVPLNIRMIDIDEYARMRRQMLPPDGVVQENENLCFLQKQASFFACDGALLAARTDGDKLVCSELLGDREKAPAIVGALGCRKGDFRTVGADKPFAMYRSLGETNNTPPSYFGLAFD